MITIKYQKLYENFLNHYKNIHVNPWHEISLEELEKIYNHLINSFNIDNDYNFKYFMDYIIKRLSGLSDAHTKFDLISPIPINFKMFDNEILVNYPLELKGSKLLSINDYNMDRVINELENVITYGTLGKRRYEIEKNLFNRYVLFGLTLFRNSEELTFKIEKLDGTIIEKKFNRNDTYENELFSSNKYLYGNNCEYKFIDNCLIYNHSSVQKKFENKIMEAINKLQNEDLTNIDTIIIDLRGNLGGNSTLNKPLMNFLNENKDKQLICLTDYRVFSGGRYALRDLIKLGATTIGEEISTPLNCYGNSNYLNIDKYHFSVSECYFHPFLGFSAESKEEFQKEVTERLLKPMIFKPDILINETKEDYINGIDTILNYAIFYSKNNLRKM